MSQPRKFNGNSQDQGESCLVIGLDAFNKSLEKIFFSNTEITYEHSANGQVDLIIEIHCKLSLMNVLFHSTMGNWGGIHRTDSLVEAFPFERAFMELQHLNECTVDITEIQINLVDTSLIISKIHDQSISHQLESILTALNHNFMHFTQGLLEIPYAIFIPVFEKKPSKGISNKQVKGGKSILVGGYFDFWGMYFKSRKNNVPSIFDLKNKRFIE